MSETKYELPFYEPEPRAEISEIRHMLLIVNPVSGRMKTKSGLFEILDELYRAPSDNSTVDPSKVIVQERRVTVVPTMHRGHATQVASIAANEGFDTVICCGGDGTLNETISGLLTIPADSRPALGYIPSGSTNDFATSIGLSSSLRGAAHTAAVGSDIAIDIGLFRPLGGAAHPARYFSYIASFGVFTAASYSTSQTAKNIFGHVAYILEGIKDIAKLRPHRAAFDLDDGTHIEGEYVFGAVTNTTSAGGVVKLPADRVSMSDGMFELLLVHHPKSAADLNKIISALLSQDFDSCPLVRLIHTPSVKITLEENLSWSLDGEEAVGGTTIEVSCLPGAVRLKVNE